jgi:4-coumarate--CoA ligase
MPRKSRWSIPIPNVSLQTFVFGSPNGPLPDKLALADSVTPDTHFLTLATYRLWSKRFALGLIKAGLKEGDRVLMFSGNSFLFPVVVMGVLMAGGVFTGANPTYVARELAHQLKDSGAKFLLTADGSLEIACDAAVEVGLSKDNVFVFDEGVYAGKEAARLGVRNWSHLIQSENEARDFEWKEPADPKEALCCLNYSSGTVWFSRSLCSSLQPIPGPVSARPYNLNAASMLEIF